MVSRLTPPTGRGSKPLATLAGQTSPDSSPTSTRGELDKKIANKMKKSEEH